jgi:hypothetical protein
MHEMRLLKVPWVVWVGWAASGRGVCLTPEKGAVASQTYS